MNQSETINEIETGLARAESIIALLESKRGNSQGIGLEFSSKICKMDVEDFLYNAFAYYCELIQGIRVDVTPKVAIKMSELSEKLSELARRYFALLGYEARNNFRAYGFNSAKEAERNRFKILMDYAEQFIDFRFGKLLTIYDYNNTPIATAQALRMIPR